MDLAAITLLAVFSLGCGCLVSLIVWSLPPGWAGRTPVAFFDRFDSDGDAIIVFSSALVASLVLALLWVVPSSRPNPHTQAAAPTVTTTEFRRAATTPTDASPPAPTSAPTELTTAGPAPVSPAQAPTAQTSTTQASTTRAVIFVPGAVTVPASATTIVPQTTTTSAAPVLPTTTTTPVPEPPTTTTTPRDPPPPRKGAERTPGD